MISNVRPTERACWVYGYNLHVVFGGHHGVNTMHFLTEVLDLYSVGAEALQTERKKEI